ncbi:MAG: LemA family protein [Chitinophagaceae bacterium]|nr:LemA family protein [Chitinophagaceae bacterium]
MGKKKIGLWVGVGIILLISIYLGSTYNSLMKKEEQVKLKWAEVESTYQRRLSLIPNLVSVVKGMSGFEAETLVEVITAREKAASGFSVTDVTGENVEAVTRLQDSLATAANRAIAVVENYPTLRGTEAYAGLQTQLEGTERRIKIARKDFNEAVASYNVAVRSSTTGLVARLFGFKPKEGFKADVGADTAVEVKFKND